MQSVEMASSVPEAFAGAGAWLAGPAPALSTEQVMTRAAARTLGAELWVASDPDDLADRLNAALDDHYLKETAHRLSVAVLHGALPELPSFGTLRGLLEAKAGSGCAPDLAEWRTVALAIADVMDRRTTTRTIAAASIAATPVVGERSASFADLYSWPSAMLEPLLAGHRADMCLAALVDLAIGERVAPAPWLLAEVVRTWVASQRSFLRLPVMFYGGADVPEAVLPKRDRVDLSEVVRDHNRDQQLLLGYIDANADDQRR